MKKAIFLIVLACRGIFSSAQNKFSDSLLRANSYQVTIDKNGVIEGPGADFILGMSKNVQFVAIGENHNTREIPQFTTALFKMLHQKYGFNHLALEQDPVMMKKISSIKIKASDSAVFGLARKYPYGFTFISDQELKMVADIASYKVKGNAIWGCDQSFGASLVLDNLIEKSGHNLALDSFAKKAMRFESLRDLEKQSFLGKGIDKGDQNLLNRLQTGNAKNEIDFGINSLAISDSIYGLMNKNKAFEGCALREAYMRSRFMEEYRNCETKGEPMPKVLLKFGNAHIQYGFEPNTGVLNLGTFTKEFAASNNMGCFSINTLIYRNDTSDWNFEYYNCKNVMRLFTNATSVDKWIIFDIAPLKSAYYNGLLKGVISKEDKGYFESNILSFDALLLIGNGNDADFDICKCPY